MGSGGDIDTLRVGHGDGASAVAADAVGGNGDVVGADQCDAGDGVATDDVVGDSDVVREVGGVAHVGATGDADAVGVGNREGCDAVGHDTDVAVAHRAVDRAEKHDGIFETAQSKATDGVVAPHHRVGPHNTEGKGDV